MIQITKKDISFGEKVDLIVKRCPRKFSCLWKETEEDPIPYTDRCPVNGLKQELQENSLHFLTFWQESAQKAFSSHEEGCPFAQQTIFWILSLSGIATLYSVNDRRVPWIPESLITSLEKEANEQPRQFYTTIYQELENLNSSWFEKFSREAKGMQVTNYTWELILKVLKVFLEGIKGTELPELFNEEDFKYLEDFLRSQSKGP